MDNDWSKRYGAWVKSLSDKTLNGLHSLIWQEINARADAGIGSGMYPALNEAEKKNPSRISAMSEYQQRTGMTMTVAKKMVEKYNIGGVHSTPMPRPLAKTNVGGGMPTYQNAIRLPSK